MSRYLLAIDQGTTSTRAILFSHTGELAYSAQRELPQIFPQDGWVEHNAETIWQDVVAVCRDVLKQAGVSASAITAIGITNQRETTVVWDKHSGKPIANAIVWQDRRTADYCASLRHKISAEELQSKTGLLLDAYFSATKIRWLLDNTPNARAQAEAGDLLFGTIDCYLIWQLTGGAKHCTDATNASRTLLFNIQSQQWDDDLLALFDIPPQMLPQVLDSAADFGETTADILGSPVQIGGVAGDQQAALVGQACFQAGMAKSTYGTGCFVMMNTGSEQLHSQHRLLSTVAYRLNGAVTYGLEGSIFMAGATLQWLRDGLQIIEHASDTAAYAEQVGLDHPVYFVPAFTGLGAPQWDPNARAAIVGLNRDIGRAEIATAALQSVAYQTRDLLEAMQADGVAQLKQLRVDGGMVANTWFTQFLADILGLQVDVPQVNETTALGAAMLAALQLGEYESLEAVAANWQLSRSYKPSLDENSQAKLYQGWQRALNGVMTISES